MFTEGSNYPESGISGASFRQGLEITVGDGEPFLQASLKREAIHALWI